MKANTQALHDLLLSHEGMRLKPYKCTAGKLTIGIGRNLDDRGITEVEAKFLLENDLAECEEDLKVIFLDQFYYLPEQTQMVLMDMRFQLGPGRFRKFKKMIQAVKQSDPQEMIKQMKDSRWYRQVPNRAEDLIRMIQVFVN